MKSIAIITGSAGLVGSDAAELLASKGMHVIGIDNDMRRRFFGEAASTRWRRTQLEKRLGNQYEHYDMSVSDSASIEEIFRQHKGDIEVVLHAAAQPSHDWAARNPFTDFEVNAKGTLNMLEITRAHAPEASFIYTSTNKVYGDTPNRLPLVEMETRWEIDSEHTYWNGIREDMSVDQTLHSLFGASKLAADILVQEYGRYFGMNTVCFRGGCLTGPAHSGAQLHGFLAYLMRCTATAERYTVFGYAGKQVRDNIHSRDLSKAFYEFILEPRSGEVYNIGGGRGSNCSVLEAIGLCEEIAGRELDWEYDPKNRIGDHIWWISDIGKFKADYPAWDITMGVEAILRDIYASNRERWEIPKK